MMEEAIRSPLSLSDFYTGHLKEVLLPFWLRSTDWEDGGYFNCYDNTGKTLVSHDKYTWSQGRFVWMYAKLASMKTDTFTEQEKSEFLKLAEHGAQFLMKHCLLDNGNCTFLMDKKGKPRLVSPDSPYDSSIFADCFVAAGLAKYATASGTKDSFEFSRKLYFSIADRIRSGSYHMQPYPTPEGYQSHNIPMILLNTTHEVLEAAEVFQDPSVPNLQQNMRHYLQQIMQFIDQDDILNEMIGTDGQRVDSLLGRYCNPGHTIEDMWFVIHAAQELGMDHHIDQAARTTSKLMEIGWDQEYGGLLLFVDRDGGEPKGDTTGIASTSMVQQIQQNWDNKLWWPHSEALYTTLLCYKLTGAPAFLRDYEKVHEYTFRTFPNPDEQVGEWIQIRMRDGEPIHKVVALPVKDPYHIIRNVIYIIELLDGWKQDAWGEISTGN